MRKGILYSLFNMSMACSMSYMVQRESADSEVPYIRSFGAVSYSLSLLDMRTWSALLHWLMKRFLMIVYSQPPRLVESVNFSKLQRAFKKTDCVKSEASSSFLVK